MTNYYRCINPECQLSKPFSFSSGLALYKKRFGIDAWERIVRFRFKRNFNNQQIKWILDDAWNLKISVTTIASICNHFERASAK
ncbi:MAG: hypothetical protein ACTSRA_23080, partial [Promethearchaeota archaeon]